MNDINVVREITITLDASGQFDPDLWWLENRHLASDFFLIPFQNRVDELRDDWEPWWGEGLGA